MGKKFQAKRPHHDSNLDQEQQYPKFIILQSKELPLTKSSPFIIEKNISSIITPILIKKK